MWSSKKSARLPLELSRELFFWVRGWSDGTISTHFQTSWTGFASAITWNSHCLQFSLATNMSSVCWRCLQRPGLVHPLQSSASKAAGLTSAFSTSSPLAVNPVKKKTNVQARGGPARGSTLRLSKNKREKTKKPPAVGERKAIRKRIVLSNTNAFEVSGLQDWAPTTYADQNAVGKMVGLPNDVVDSLRAVESFMPTQGWGFFRRPATLIREETLELAKHIEQCTDSKSDRQTLRRIIVGEKGSGKSVLLLQAQAMAFMAGWVVIHIPEGEPFKSLLKCGRMLTLWNLQRRISQLHTQPTRP